MKNIKFYEAPKYNTPEYEKIEDMIYRTEVVMEDNGSYSFGQIKDAELGAKLLKEDGWTQGRGEAFEDMLILTYEGKKYYRDIENVGTEDDIIYENLNDEEGEPQLTYVTSIVYEPEPEFDENEPSDPYVSQYPLEDILDEFFISCYDSYDEENEKDKENSYIEFAADDIEDIRKVLSIIGKHVYNKQEGDYVLLKIEDQ
jgi:hypothetical protein